MLGREWGWDSMYQGTEAQKMLCLRKSKSPVWLPLDFGARSEGWVRQEARQDYSWKVRLVLHCRRPCGQWKVPENFQ